MIERLFEIPYNFDKKIVQALYSLQVDFNTDSFLERSMDPLFKVYCFYVPIYPEDAKSVMRSEEYLDLLSMMSYEQYSSHLQYINSYFNGSIQLLINGKDQIVSQEKILEYHNNFNINKFCVNTDEQAKIIREVLPKADITASITMRLTLEDIILLDDKLYNNIVLFFPFNRNFNQLKLLPKKFKYIIIPNSYCDYRCDGIHHWYRSYSNLDNYNICPMQDDLTHSYSIFIRPMDIQYFDEYIFAYKLQDRGWSTIEIIKSLLSYVSDYSYTYYRGIESFNIKMYSEV